MTVALRDSGSQGNSGAGSTLGLSTQLRVVAGDIVVIKTTQNQPAVVTLSDGTHNFSQKVAANVGTGIDTQTVFYFTANATLNTTLSVSLNTPCTFRGVQWATVQGGQNIPVGAGQELFAPGTGADAFTSGAIVVANQPGLMLAWGYDFDTFNTGLKAGTGYTPFDTFANETGINGGSSLLASKRITSTGNIAATMTMNTGSGGDHGTIFGVFIQEVSGTQTLTPNADKITGNWVPSIGAVLYGTMNEATRDDTNYASLTGNVGSAFRVALSTANDPMQSTGHVVSYVLTGTNGNMSVRLVQDANTTIASWSHVPVATAFTEYDQTLSNAQADSITNYGNLSLEFTAS